MDTNALLVELLDRVTGHVRVVLAGTDAEQLAYRPGPAANPIGWLVWHSSRVLDRHHAHLAGQDQVWLTQGWVDRLGFDLDPADHGYGHTVEQVGKVRPEGPDDLLGYHLAVDEVVRRTLATITADALDVVIDRSYDPPVTAGVRIVSMLDDAIQHLGQARYVRGLATG